MRDLLQESWHERIQGQNSMNREDIIRMAREAELNAHGLVIDRLERFAALVAAHEREQILDLECPLGWVKVNDIRARGEK